MKGEKLDWNRERRTGTEGHDRGGGTGGQGEYQGTGTEGHDRETGTVGQGE